MTAYANMLTNVAVNAPMCPQPLMLNAMQRAAQDFFTRSRVWHETLDPFFVTVKLRDIDVDHPTGARIINILSASFEGAALTRATPTQLDRAVPNWRTTAVGDPEYVTCLTPEIIRLAPHPPAKGKLIIEAALAPLLTSTAIPDTLAAEYQTALEHGTTAIIMAIGKKPWTDLPLAAYHNSQFESAINTAFSRQSKGFVAAKLRSTLEYR